MDFSNSLNVWWLIMVVINGLSVITYGFFCRKSAAGDYREPENVKYKRIMRICGGIFVAVSMYRSVFVCSYPNRLSWFPCMFNSPLVIRMIATFAEISYALLVMVPILHINKEMPARCSFARSKVGDFLVYKLPYMTFICLFTAQFFAYSGLFTQYLVLFAIEETLWTLGFLSIAPAAITQTVNVFKNHKKDPAYRFIRVFLVLLSTFTVGYLTYQIGFSLPFTYYSQLAADFQKNHLEFSRGIGIALHQFTACRDFDTWGGIGFFIWHSCYFSICTWLNLFYSMAPRKLRS